MLRAFLAGQFFVVIFIGLHDWVPLGKLSNLQGIRAADSRVKLIVVTLLSALPFAISLVGSAFYAGAHFPSWLMWTLWITYGAAIYGMLRAWWFPYFFGGDPERAKRYQLRFAQTHAFLPTRNGIRPDTLHVIFHGVLVVTVLLLVVLSLSGRLE
jgi:hypothetical protein